MKLLRKWAKSLLCYIADVDGLTLVSQERLKEEQSRKWDYCHKWWAERDRADRAERLLNEDLTPKEVGRAHHIADLEAKNASLKKTVRQMQLKAEEFNNTLYATGLIVNCTGCLAGGPGRYEDLTEAKVKKVKEIASRLGAWWANNQHRATPSPAPQVSHPAPQGDHQSTGQQEI